MNDGWILQMVRNSKVSKCEFLRNSKTELKELTKIHSLVGDSLQGFENNGGSAAVMACLVLYKRQNSLAQTN